MRMRLRKIAATMRAEDGATDQLIAAMATTYPRAANHGQLATDDLNWVSPKRH